MQRGVPSLGSNSEKLMNCRKGQKERAAVDLFFTIMNECAGIDLHIRDNHEEATHTHSNKKRAVVGSFSSSFRGQTFLHDATKPASQNLCFSFGLLDFLRARRTDGGLMILLSLMVIIYGSSDVVVARVLRFPFFRCCVYIIVVGDNDVDVYS